MINLGMRGKLALIILEPQNLRLLKEGRPIGIDLGEILGPNCKDMILGISYTPDVAFIEERIGLSDQSVGIDIDVDKLLTALEASKHRPEVFREPA